jgi:hypothetical protein
MGMLADGHQGLGSLPEEGRQAQDRRSRLSEDRQDYLDGKSSRTKDSFSAASRSKRLPQSDV